VPGGLALDGNVNSRGLVSLANMAYFMHEMGARATALPRFVPYPLSCVARVVCFLIARVAGWKRPYRRYTE
jgi:hypothetical protein